MDVSSQDLPDGSDDLRQPTVARAQSTGLFERTIVSLLTLLAAVFHTSVLMLRRPQRFAQLLEQQPNSLAPPFSFLLVSLLAMGISIRSAVEFYERRVDHTLLNQLAETVRSFTLEDVFVLTVPCIILVALTGAGLARAVRPDSPFVKNPVVNAVCYTGGLQFVSMTMACLVLLVVKLGYGSSTVISETGFDRVVLGGSAALILASMVPLYCVVRSDRKTRWARSRITAGFLCMLCSATVLLGVSIANSVSFDLNSVIADVRRRHQREMLGDVRVAIRTLDSQMVQDELGQAAIEMTVALVNVSDQTLLIPRPFALEHAYEPKLAPLVVLAASTNLAEESGWVIEPDQTQLVRWMLKMPEWCADPTHQQAPLPVLFSCFPMHGTDDLFRTHPIGDASPVLGELSWPMYEAHCRGNRKQVARMTAMMAGRVVQ